MNILIIIIFLIYLLLFAILIKIIHNVSNNKTKETFAETKDLVNLTNLANRQATIKINNKFLTYDNINIYLKLSDELTEASYFVITNINEQYIGINKYRLFHPPSLSYLSYSNIFDYYDPNKTEYDATLCATREFNDPTRIFILPSTNNTFILAFILNNEKIFYLHTIDDNLIWSTDKNNVANVEIIPQL